MRRSLVTLIAGILVGIGVCSGCQNLTPQGWDLAYGLVGHAGKEAISHEVNPKEENNTTVIINPSPNSSPQPPDDDYEFSPEMLEYFKQHGVDPNETSILRKKIHRFLNHLFFCKSGKPRDRIEDLKDPLTTSTFHAGDNLYCSFNYETGNVKGKKVFFKLFDEQGNLILEKTHTNSLDHYLATFYLSAPEKTGKYTFEAFDEKQQKLLSHTLIVVETEERKKALLEEKAKRESSYVFFVEDENKNKRKDEEEDQKASKRLQNLEDSLRLSSFRVGDGLLCKFHHNMSENVEGKKISFTLLDEEGNLVSKKSYINSTKNSYEGYISVEAPKRMGRYTLKAFDESEKNLFSHILIINE